ncbi:MAG TPA: response regulator transcription factor [Nannocystis sp.]|jgi:two-component system response regulator DesR
MARILLVEDFAEIRRLIAALLTSHGHTVVGEVDRGDEVLAAVRASEPEVVLLDISLPRRNGLDVLVDLCAAAPAVVSIMLSSHDDPYYINEARRRGAVDFVVKNDAPERLIRAIADGLATQDDGAPGTGVGSP